MANLNKVMLIGNLTRDPELKYTPKGTAVAEMGLAINRVWNNDQGQKQEETTFVDVTLWGRTAELAQQYLFKGSSCYVEGRLQLESWDDKETGKKRSKLKIVGEVLQFLGSKQSGDSQGHADRPAQGARSSEYGKRETHQNGAKPPQKVADEYQEDDDIPF